jgi:hypothetical protein
MPTRVAGVLTAGVRRNVVRDEDFSTMGRDGGDHRCRGARRTLGGLWVDEHHLAEHDVDHHDHDHLDDAHDHQPSRALVGRRWCAGHGHRDGDSGS